jgi:hypothetical protein
VTVCVFLSVREPRPPPAACSAADGVADPVALATRRAAAQGCQGHPRAGADPAGTPASAGEPSSIAALTSADADGHADGHADADADADADCGYGASVADLMAALIENARRLIERDGEPVRSCVLRARAARCVRAPARACSFGSHRARSRVRVHACGA